jgi:putative FmdB family regulatory protein
MTYEYECKKCGQRFERQQKVTEAPIRVCPCPEEAAVSRVISGGLGVLLPVKGSTPPESSGGGGCCGGGCGRRH